MKSKRPAKRQALGRRLSEHLDASNPITASLPASGFPVNFFGLLVRQADGSVRPVVAKGQVYRQQHRYLTPNEMVHIVTVAKAFTELTGLATIARINGQINRFDPPSL